MARTFWGKSVYPFNTLQFTVRFQCKAYLIHDLFPWGVITATRNIHRQLWRGRMTIRMCWGTFYGCLSKPITRHVLKQQIPDTFSSISLDVLRESTVPVSCRWRIGLTLKCDTKRRLAFRMWENYSYIAYSLWDRTILPCVFTVYSHMVHSHRKSERKDFYENRGRLCVMFPVIVFYVK